jgi:hypothetical protein
MHAHWRLGWGTDPRRGRSLFGAKCGNIDRVLVLNPLRLPSSSLAADVTLMRKPAAPVLLLATPDTDLSLVPAAKAKREARKIAAETGQPITLRDPLTDEVIGQLPRGRRAGH